MKKVLPLLHCLSATLLAAGLLLGQDTPNFSGTWILDAAKSDPMGGGRPGGGGGGMQMEVTLEIKHEGKNLTITRKISRGGQEIAQELNYTTDNAENRNPGMGMGGQEVVSKSRWEGRKLITEWSQTRTTPDGEFATKSKETRSLSDDGKVLTIEISNSGGPRGEVNRKQVFNKK